MIENKAINDDVIINNNKIHIDQKKKSYLKKKNDINFNKFKSQSNIDLSLNSNLNQKIKSHKKSDLISNDSSKSSNGSIQMKMSEKQRLLKSKSTSQIKSKASLNQIKNKEKFDNNSTLKFDEGFKNSNLDSSLKETDLKITKNQKSQLFKISFSAGKNTSGKIIVRDGDNLYKLAQKFAVNNKLSESRKKEI